VILREASILFTDQHIATSSVDFEYVCPGKEEDVSYDELT
jgi:hypothetical protein